MELDLCCACQPKIIEAPPLKFEVHEATCPLEILRAQMMADVLMFGPLPPPRFQTDLTLKVVLT